MKIKRVAVENALSFKEVEMREPLVEDLTAAERITGKVSGFDFSVAVLAQICTFDGKQLVAEDLRRLKLADFLALSKETEAMPGMESVARELSASPVQPGSASPK